MLFSFKEFDETKNLIIKQFGNQPAVDLVSDDTQTIYQYQKLLNKIKYQKNVDHVYFGKSIKSMPKLYKKLTVPYSASRRALNDNNSNLCQTVFSDPYAKFKDQQSKLNSMNRLSSEDRQSNFYLTLPPQKHDRGSLKLIDSKENNQILVFSKNQKEEIWQQPESAQSKQLLNLRINILELQKQQKYLHTQISQLEQSVRYYRCLNNQTQHKINQREKKYLVELNLALKKQSNLNTVTSRNKYFEEKLESTESFFTKSLKSIKLNRKSETRKCEELVDDVAQKILTMKYLKKKIEQQKLQIAKLDEKHRYKSRRIQDNKNMKQYATTLLNIQSLANFIKTNSYGRISELLELNSTLSHRCSIDRDPGLDCTGQANANDQINFLQLIKEVLKVYFKLLSDEERLEQNYKYKINQMASNRRIQCQEFLPTPQAYETNELKRSQNQKSSNKFSKFFTDPRKAINQNLSGSKEHSHLSLRQLKNEQIKIDRCLTEVEIKKQQKELKKINNRILLMEQKSKFFIKKCIKYLEHIVQKWLKFDQSAINFVVEVSNKFVMIDTKIKKQVSECISKGILKEYFENWEKYTFFFEEFYNNPILNCFSSKDTLSKIFKKVIKTKCTYTNVPTHRIFIKYLKQMHRQKVEQIYENVKHLLRVAVEIFQYSSKFQVFIVNDCQKEEGKQSEQSQQKKNYSIQVSNKAELLKGEKKEYRKTTSIRKVAQKPEALRIVNDDENCSDIEAENELEQEKEKEMPVSEAHTVVNLIMDYQSEINKISKISRKHRRQ